MSSRLASLIATATVSGWACGGTLVQIPPRIDLTRHEIVGVIQFESTSQGDLAPYTTRRFIEGIRADQGLIRIVELGPQDALLRSVGHARLSRDAFQAIGEQHQLTTIVAGDLDVSNVRPSVSLAPSLSGIRAAADVDAKLSVRLVEVESGASLWSRTTEATRRVGNISLGGGGPIQFDADNPEQAYGELVTALVEHATADFRVTWEKRQ